MPTGRMWDCINNIKLSLNHDGHSMPDSEQLFRNKNGVNCLDPVENAQNEKDHFQNVSNIKGD